MERKEAEAAAERACQEEQRRLQEEAEVQGERERRDEEEHCVKQERQEREEEEARHCQLRQETSLSPVVTLGRELPWSKGKGLELALESEGAQELRRCDSCVRRNTECVCVKVSST